MWTNMEMTCGPIENKHKDQQENDMWADSNRHMDK